MLIPFVGPVSQLTRINRIDTKCVLLGQILSWGLEPGLFIPNKVQIIPDSRSQSGCCLPLQREHVETLVGNTLIGGCAESGILMILDGEQKSC